MAWVGLIPTWCVAPTHPPPMSKVHSFLLSQPPIVSFNYKYRSSLLTIHGPIPKTTVQAMQGRLHRCLLLIKLSTPVNFGSPALLRILRPKTGGAVRAQYFWDFRFCGGINWLCSGASFGTFNFKLRDEIPIVNRLMISMVDRSSTNLNLSSTGMHSALSLVCDRYS